MRDSTVRTPGAGPADTRAVVEALLGHAYRVACPQLLKSVEKPRSNTFQTAMQAISLSEIRSAFKSKFDDAIAWRDTDVDRADGERRYVFIGLERASDEASQRLSLSRESLL